MNTNDGNVFDCIIVGAGLAGLAGAKAYLDVYPVARVLILESQDSVGGVWSEERAFPGLCLQQSTTVFSLPGLDWKDINPARNNRGFAKSESVHRYFDTYANKFKLRERTKLATKVISIKKLDGLLANWEVFTESTKDNEARENFLCKKLMISTGQYSQVNMPNIQKEDFTPQVWHTKDMGKMQEHVANQEIRRIAIYGAGKSAFDIISEMVSMGKEVTWVIRKSGRGPGWLLNPAVGRSKDAKPIDPYALTRIMGFLLPSLYHDDGYTWTRAFMARTWIGRGIVKLLMKFATKGAIAEMSPINENIQKVMPAAISPLWAYSPLGANNYEVNPYDYIRDGKVKTVRDDTLSFTGTTINFVTEPSIDVDGVIMATGYDTSCSFFDADQQYHLGVPSSSYTSEQTVHWKSLDDQAAAEVYKRYPILADPPPHWTPPSHNTLTPYRLWRFLVPPAMAKAGDNSLIFLGEAANVGTCQVASVSAVWAVAYLSGKINIPEDIEEQTAYETTYVQKRQIGDGPAQLMLGFDALPYITKLIKDMGMNPFMKKRWWKELAEPYLADDFVDLTEKWMEKEKIPNQEAPGIVNK